MQTITNIMLSPVKPRHAKTLCYSKERYLSGTRKNKPFPLSACPEVLVLKNEEGFKATDNVHWGAKLNGNTWLEVKKLAGTCLNVL